MTSLCTLSTSSFSDGHDDQHYLAANIQNVEDGDEGQMIEHDIEAPSPIQVFQRSHLVFDHTEKDRQLGTLLLSEEGP